MSGSISDSVLIMIRTTVIMIMIVIMKTNKSGSYAHGRTAVTLLFPLEISQKNASRDGQWQLVTSWTVIAHHVMDSDSSQKVYYSMDSGEVSTKMLGSIASVCMVHVLSWIVFVVLVTVLVVVTSFRRGS